MHCRLRLGHPAGCFCPLTSMFQPSVLRAELLIDGDHSLAQFAEASTRVISRCVAHLWQKVSGLGGCGYGQAADGEAGSRWQWAGSRG